MAEFYLPNLPTDGVGAGNRTPASAAAPLPVTVVSGGGGGAVTIADGADVAQGTTTDAAVTNPASAATEIALLKGLMTQIGEVQTTPTQFTLLRRLKDLLTSIVLSAGSAIIGKVGIDQTTPGTTNAVSPGTSVQAPTTTVTAAMYSAGDLVGSSAGAGGSAIISLTTINSASGRPVMLKSVTVKDKSDQKPDLSLLFFKATPSGGTYTDKVALDFGAGDLANLVGVLQVHGSDYLSYDSMAVVNYSDIDELLSVSATTLFVLVHSDGTPTFTSTSDLTIELAFEKR